MPARRMTLPEMVHFYWETADECPDILAALYVNFHQFNQVEFLIFHDRLCSAILVANATRQSVEAKGKNCIKRCEMALSAFPDGKVNPIWC